MLGDSRRVCYLPTIRLCKDTPLYDRQEPAKTSLRLLTSNIDIWTHNFNKIIHTIGILFFMKIVHRLFVYHSYVFIHMDIFLYMMNLRIEHGGLLQHWES